MDEPQIRTLLGDEATAVLAWAATAPPPARLVLPGPDFVDRAWGPSDRTPAWLRSFQALFDAGRLVGTGYLSLLTATPDEQDPVGLAELAVEGGCSGLIASERVLGVIARTHAHRVPLIARTHPGAGAPEIVVRRLRDLGAVGIGVTLAAETGATEGLLALTVAAQAEGLFALVHTPAIPGKPRDGLAATAARLGAALAWQELVAIPPVKPGARPSGAASGAAIVALRTQVAEGWLGRVGMLGGTPDRPAPETLRAAIRATVLHKRAGGIGSVTGAAASTLPREAGVALLHAIQDVWACGLVTVAGG
jgi:class I fructose-bisphosphate aldolase